jgi:hypothetical protein
METATSPYCDFIGNLAMFLLPSWEKVSPKATDEG